MDGAEGASDMPAGRGWLDAAGDALAAATVAPDAFDYRTAAIRLAAALLLGGLVGLERERRHRPAGLRTHMLVAFAAALFTLMALEIAAAGDRLGPELRVDPSRVLEAVTAGVAFLAAGAIIRHGASVRGLTTGAGLWLSGAVGVTCGLGYLPIAAAAAIAAIIVLAVIRQLEP